MLSTHSATQLILNELSFLLPQKLLFLLLQKTHPELLYLQLIFARLHSLEENNAKNIRRFFFNPTSLWMGTKSKTSTCLLDKGKNPTNQTKTSQQRKKTEGRTVQRVFAFEKTMFPCFVNLMGFPFGQASCLFA